MHFAVTSSFKTGSSERFRATRPNTYTHTHIYIHIHIRMYTVCELKAGRINRETREKKKEGGRAMR